LDKELQFTYDNDYINLLEAGFFTKWVYRKSHKELEKPLPQGINEGATILEIAAQADQHRQYVSGGWANYIVSDIDIKPLMKSKASHSALNSEPKSQVHFQEIDATKIIYADDHFDRLIATCLIAHMKEPVDALVEWRRVVKDGGYLSLYVACEPSILLRFARVLTRKRAMRKSSMDFDLMHYYQHTSSYPAMMEFIKFVFKNDKISISKYPFRFLPWDLNFWTIVTIKLSKKDTETTFQIQSKFSV
jgi:ubiquinone/menaquinone biosynthesis C-methylase UbiE